LKILNRRDSATTDICEFLTEVKKHLHRNGFNVPFPIPSTSSDKSEIVVITETELSRYMEEDVTPPVHSLSNGEDQLHNSQYCFRVLTFIPGTLFHDVTQNDQLLFQLGRYFAMMHDNLKDFSHPYMKSRQLLQWDLKHLHTGPVRSLIPKAIKDPIKCQWVTQIINDFQTHVAPHIPTLPHSVLHNDFNDNNIIVHMNSENNYDINGAIDFTDCVYSPTLFDVGISLAYMILDKGDINVVTPFLAGYMSQSRLSDKEKDLLYYVILARLAQSCINGEYTYQLEPANEYLLSSVKPAWIAMELIISTGKEKCDLIWFNYNN
jgi:hydroxylysine kinase